MITKPTFIYSKNLGTFRIPKSSSLSVCTLVCYSSFVRVLHTVPGKGGHIPLSFPRSFHRTPPEPTQRLRPHVRCGLFGVHLFQSFWFIEVLRHCISRFLFSQFSTSTSPFVPDLVLPSIHPRLLTGDSLPLMVSPSLLVLKLDLSS